jgi:hypothetical protein
LEQGKGGAGMMYLSVFIGFTAGNLAYWYFFNKDLDAFMISWYQGSAVFACWVVDKITG